MDQGSEVMRALTRNGVERVRIPDEEDRSFVGRYWNAVETYLSWAETAQLNQLEAEMTRRAAGSRVGGVELAFDLAVIEREASRGTVSFESIYES